MSSKPTQVVFDPWDTYWAETEEGPVVISFDEGATREDLTGNLPYCARVIIPIQNPNEIGGPVSPATWPPWHVRFRRPLFVWTSRPKRPAMN